MSHLSSTAEIVNVANTHHIHGKMRVLHRYTTNTQQSHNRLITIAAQLLHPKPPDATKGLSRIHFVTTHLTDPLPTGHPA